MLRSKSFFLLSLTFGLLLTSFLAVRPQAKAAPATATLLATSCPANVAVGSNFTVDFRVNTGGQSVGAVRVYANYSNNIQYVSADATGSVFDFEATPPSGNNPLIFERLNTGTGHNSTSGQILRVMFKAITAGTATINISKPDSEVLATSDLSNILNATTGGTCNLVGTGGGPTPPPPPPAGTAALNASSCTTDTAVNSTFTVSFTVHTGGVNVGAVRLSVNHTNNVQYVSADAAGTVFDFEATAPAATNPIITERLSTGTGFTGSSGHIVRLTFKAVATGTATFTINEADSQVLSTSDLSNILSTTNNGTCTLVPPPQANVTLAKSVNKTSAKPGDTLTYSVTYTNGGSGNATNVKITDAIPTGATYVTGSASNGGTLSGNTLTWTIGSVAAGGSGTVTFQARIPVTPVVSLTVTNPASGVQITGQTVAVQYAVSGDLAGLGVDRIILKLDNNTAVTDMLDGTHQFTNVAFGAHTLTGYLAQTDGTPISYTRFSRSFFTRDVTKHACFNVLLSNRTMHGQDHSYPLTIEVKTTGGAVTEWIQLNNTANGTIQIGEAQRPGITTRLAAGTYNVTYKADGYRSATVSNVSNILTQCLAATTLKAGDFDSDGDIDLTDLLRLSQNRYGARSDFTIQAIYKNATIQLKDLLHVLQNKG